MWFGAKFEFVDFRVILLYGGESLGVLGGFLEGVLIVLITWQWLLEVFFNEICIRMGFSLLW